MRILNLFNKGKITKRIHNLIKANKKQKTFSDMRCLLIEEYKKIYTIPPALGDYTLEDLVIRKRYLDDISLFSENVTLSIISGIIVSVFINIGNFFVANNINCWIFMFIQILILLFGVSILARILGLADTCFNTPHSKFLQYGTKDIEIQIIDSLLATFSNYDDLVNDIINSVKETEEFADEEQYETKL